MARLDSTVSVLTPSSSSVLSLAQEPILILDSGASCSVVSTSLLPHIHNSQTHYTQVSTAAEGQSLHITGEGELGPPTAVLLSHLILRTLKLQITQILGLGRETMGSTRSPYRFFSHFSRLESTKFATSGAPHLILMCWTSGIVDSLTHRIV